jgi:hypothetical protein
LRLQLKLIVGITSLLFLNLACTVKLEDSTPGAKSSCAASSSVINAFQCNTFTNYIAGGPGCTGCHSQGAAGSGAMSYYVDTSCCPSSCGTSLEAQANYCTAILKGQKLVDYPQSSSHVAPSAQQYTAAQIQGLIDWVNSN